MIPLRMTPLREYDASNLHGLLQHQTKLVTSTHSACAAQCGRSARGGGYCADCIDAELKRRGIDMAATRYVRDQDGRIRQGETSDARKFGDALREIIDLLDDGDGPMSAEALRTAREALGDSQ